MDIKKEIRTLPKLDVNLYQTRINGDIIRSYNNALEYASRGSEDMAILELKRCLSLRPDFVEAHTLLGYCYILTHDEKEAKRHMLKAVSLSESGVRAYMLLNDIGVLAQKPNPAVKLNKWIQEKEASQGIGSRGYEERVKRGEKTSGRTTSSRRSGTSGGYQESRTRQGAGSFQVSDRYKETGEDRGAGRYRESGGYRETGEDRGLGRRGESDEYRENDGHIESDEYRETERANDTGGKNPRLQGGNYFENRKTEHDPYERGVRRSRKQGLFDKLQAVVQDFRKKTSGKAGKREAEVLKNLDYKNFMSRDEFTGDVQIQGLQGSQKRKMRNGVFAVLGFLLFCWLVYWLFF